MVITSVPFSHKSRLLGFWTLEVTSGELLRKQSNKNEFSVYKKNTYIFKQLLKGVTVGTEALVCLYQSGLQAVRSAMLCNSQH
jgi:hypothetical protein